MKNKWIYSLLALFVFSSALASEHKYSVSLMAGVAVENNAFTMSSIDSAGTQYILSNSSSAQVSPVIGISVLRDFPFFIVNHPVSWQPGFAINYINNFNLTGSAQQGFQGSLDSYSYSYNLNSVQALFLNRLVFLKEMKVHPFLGLGLGMTQNSTSQYSVQNAGATNAPIFANQTSTNFSYQLSAGVDFPLNENWSVGGFYAFNDIGSVGLNQPANPPRGAGGVPIPGMSVSSFAVHEFMVYGTYLFN